MEFNTEMMVDLEEVEEFIKSNKFTQFLLDNTDDFAVAGYVLTALFDRIKEDRLTFQ